MGIKEEDKDSIKILMDHLAAKSSNVGKEKEIAKNKFNQINFDLESFIFMPKKGGKLAQTHLRWFKRFCKFLITNLVDLYPAKKQIT